ncbi:MAG: LptF/LptG family permease [Chlamydiia bacterium]|nr:LptF/LptG family permease [Chlamydiia bacterium]
MRIWQRYFFFDTLKVIGFFLAAFWGLYVLIDYASHSGTFHHHKDPLSFFQLVVFYTGELIRRSEILLPFAILVGVTRVLTKLNTRNELVALLASGQSMKKLLFPFIGVGLLGVGFLYLNEEVFVPWAMESSREIGDIQKSTSSKSAKHLRLKGGSLLIFGSLKPETKELFDVFWIPSIDDVWRFKTLSLEAIPKASEGEHFSRGKDNMMRIKERFSARLFPEIEYNPKRLLETITPADELSISELWKKSPSNAKSQKEARIKTQLFRKLFLPWLALFAVLIPAPFATQFTRRLNVFFIYVISLFSLFFIYVVFNVATILGERQLYTPFWVMFIPFILVSAILAYRLKKIS